MKIERVNIDENTPVLRLSGELDLSSVPEVRRQIRALIDEGLVSIIINLDGLDFIDSSGLGVLVGGLARVREKKGDIIIVCANRRIMRVFEMTRLTQLFTITTGEAEAGRQLKDARRPRGEQAA